MSDSKPKSAGTFKRKSPSEGGSSAPSSGKKKVGGERGPNGGWKKFKPWRAEGGSDHKGSKKNVALTKKDRKDLRKERKAAKPNADIIEEANKVWSNAFSSMPTSRRVEEISKVLEKVKGKILEVSKKHDSSRALQLMLKYGNEKQRKEIIDELAAAPNNTLYDLASNKFGHYFVLKALQYGEDYAQKIFLTHLRGFALKMASSADSAKVLDYLYASVSKKDQNNILQEFFGNEFLLFSQQLNVAGESMDKIAEKYPEKVPGIKENLSKFLEKCTQKSMMMFRFVHGLIISYITILKEEQELREFFNNLYQFIPALHHSVDGCRLLLTMLSVGAAKDRKNILKEFKGIVLNMAERQEGYMVLSRALEVVDDTVLLEKSIISELIPASSDLITHQWGSKIFLRILNPNNAAIFSKSEQNEIANILTTSLASDKLFKKEPVVKRFELLGHVLVPLLESIEKKLSDLLVSSFGSHVLVEAVKESYALIHDAVNKDDAAKMPATLKKKVDELKKPTERILRAIVTAAVKSNNQNDDDDDDESSSSSSSSTSTLKSSPLTDRFGHYTYKRLLQTLEPIPTSFASDLLDAIESQLFYFASQSRSAFVLSQYIERPIPSLNTRLIKSLKPHAAKLEKITKEKSFETFTDENGKEKQIQVSTAGVECLLRLVKGEKSTTPASSSNGANNNKKRKLDVDEKELKERKRLKQKERRAVIRAESKKKQQEQQQQHQKQKQQTTSSSKKDKNVKKEEEEQAEEEYNEDEEYDGEQNGEEIEFEGDEDEEDEE